MGWGVGGIRILVCMCVRLLWQIEGHVIAETTVAGPLHGNDIFPSAETRSQCLESSCAAISLIDTHSIVNSTMQQQTHAKRFP